MFHTPNLDLVGLQAEAWGRPHRRVPVPAPGATGEEGALADALAGARGGTIVAGAIASSYQYTRLLRVAGRLGCRVYAPLWGKTGARVVEQEVGAGLDIRFVHLAAEGLPAEWLGERLDAERLRDLAAQAGGPRAFHPAGEGGEFETLVVDAPFFRARIVLDDTETEWRSGVGRLTVRRAHLEPKRRDGPTGRL